MRGGLWDVKKHALHIFATRWMFFTDVHANYPKIEAAWMNGQNRTILVDTRLGNPTGITIDFFMNDRVYWCDSKENVIESINPDGSNRLLVVPSGEFLKKKHWALSLRDEFVNIKGIIGLWTSWETRKGRFIDYMNSRYLDKTVTIISYLYKGDPRTSWYGDIPPPWLTLYVLNFAEGT